MVVRCALRGFALLSLGLGLLTPARAEYVHVAVAANFRSAFEALLPPFTQRTAHKVTVSSGSTGKLFAQIQHGAPYDVFLAADEARPARLEQSALAVPGSRFTYARGRLVLWSAEAGVVDAQGDVLKTNFRRLAIANPKIAPYGRAARESLTALGLWKAIMPRLVQGEDVGQTFQFVHSGNAELGFVALAQVRQVEGRGSHWIVPARLHAPIDQQAVLLERGRKNRAAHALLDYLRSPETRETLARYGYEAP